MWDLGVCCWCWLKRMHATQNRPSGTSEQAMVEYLFNNSCLHWRVMKPDFLLESLYFFTGKTEWGLWLTSTLLYQCIFCCIINMIKMALSMWLATSSLGIGISSFGCLAGSGSAVTMGSWPSWWSASRFFGSSCLFYFGYDLLMISREILRLNMSLLGSV